MNHINELPLTLRANPARVVVRPFHLGWQANGVAPSRTHRIAYAVLDMDDIQVAQQLTHVLRDFENRHWQTRRIFTKRFNEVACLLNLDASALSKERQQLIGAYFCHEYSYAAAALTNPSVVPHPDQSGLDKHSSRIILSLRAVGEGHISSIAFREGIITGNGLLELAPEPPFATATDALGAEDLRQDGPVTVYRQEDSTLSGTVIFPITAAQANGLEDLRLLKFTHDDGDVEWLGTYTAYNGHQIQSELMRTKDFRQFEMVPMTGSAARNKGMGLFPRKVNGRYMMCGRQDGENLFLISSDTLTNWEGGDLVLAPRYPWEMVQIGNCGAPIEIDEGWLLLTHGVGAMRQYSIGAVLLDKDDPSRVIARCREPIVGASGSNREGYVPNVVYTCGAMRHGDLIFMPYGVADSSVAFACLPIKEMLAHME